MLKLAGGMYLIALVILLLPPFAGWLRRAHPLNAVLFGLMVVFLVVAGVMVVLVGRPRR